MSQEIEDIVNDYFKRDDTFCYGMLSRLESDCNYFLGFGARSENVLYFENVKEHIAVMKMMYERFVVKPEWLTMEQICELEKNMLSQE